MYFLNFGCGSRIYSNSNIAKNSLELQKLSDFFSLKFKLNVYPIAPLPYGSMTYIHALFVKKKLLRFSMKAEISHTA